MIEILVEKGAPTDARDFDGNTPSLLLAKNPKGKVDALDFLFTIGADLMIRDSHTQETPLLWFVSNTPHYSHRLSTAVVGMIH
jgi:ankyrin repeat protein